MIERRLSRAFLRAPSRKNKVPDLPGNADFTRRIPIVFLNQWRCKMSSMGAIGMQGMPDFSQMQKVQSQLSSAASSSGGLTKSEFESITKDTPLGQSGNADTVYSKMDTNGDGKVTSSELQSFQQGMMKDMQSTMEKFGGATSSAGQSGSGSGGNSTVVQSLLDSLGTSTSSGSASTSGANHHHHRTSASSNDSSGTQGTASYIQKLLQQFVAQQGSSSATSSLTGAGSSTLSLQA
jgi:hypothetical protein